MIEVCKRVLLHALVLSGAQVRPQTVRGAGGIARIEKPGDEGEDGAYAHEHALPGDVGEVAPGNANVDDVRHEDGDDHLKGAFDDHEQNAEDGIFAVVPQIGDDASDLMHGRSPPLRRRLMTSRSLRHRTPPRGPPLPTPQAVARTRED